jgi:intein/homing endonuclease
MNVNAVGKIGVEVNHAYLAGLIDGDGCIMATIERHGEKKFGFRVRVEVKITQKESTLLKFLHSYYRIGIVRKNRTTFDWIIRDKSHVNEILDLIYPYTKAKIKQIEYARQILSLSDSSKSGLMKMARLADALSKFNVRSKNRRLNYASMIQIPVSSND